MITDLPKHNLKAFIDLAKRIDDVKFGTVTATFRIHRGYITDVVLQEFKRTRYEIKDKKS